ncbi:acyltransferase [Leifsonia sp. H3M29-4]|uniref:acyltransferase family protein n=1 Tax=Salinibacterium metalliresistens TaxID=3031321 RepID=UPI0023DC33FD|nr:acyltransferase [Salinibacterium metalliresistens]MDF1477792.1 acyltransferase [Salinibacterium metalliresistens]
MIRPAARIQSIDLIRGIAVALVMLRHAYPEQFAGAGVVGVVMFFSLSGYLITGVLLDEVARNGGVRFGGFYARRAARLVPALVVFVAVFALVTLVFDPLSDRQVLPRTVLVALTWTADLPFDHGSDAIFHLWTLAVEEQFYLLWPVLLVAAARARRVGWLFAAASLAALAGCVATLVWLWPHPDLAYALPTSWVGCLLIGAAARVWRDRLVVRGALGPVALVVLLAVSVVPLRGHASTYLVWGPVIAALTAIMLLAWRDWRTVGAPVLRPLVLLGTVSYAAYLWNYPLTLWLRGTTEFAGLVSIVLTLVAASASWMLVERPIARLMHSRRAVPA